MLSLAEDVRGEEPVVGDGVLNAEKVLVAEVDRLHDGQHDSHH
jgi:hypothetical protein